MKFTRLIRQQLFCRRYRIRRQSQIRRQQISAAQRHQSQRYIDAVARRASPHDSVQRFVGCAIASTGDYGVKAASRRVLDLPDRTACMRGRASLDLHTSGPQNFFYARDVLRALLTPASGCRVVDEKCFMHGWIIVGDVLTRMLVDEMD
jgi:hypothetical protein